VSKLPKTAFQKGCAPGPGRPKGSRSRLQEFVLQLIDEDFREHGKEVLARVRAKWPQIYLTAIVGLLPKQSQVEKLSPLGELSDEELELLEEYFASSRAKLVRKIERHNGAATDEKEQAGFPLASPDSVDSK
jgi:hypothetical protein